MGAVRVVVDDVDSAIDAFVAGGYVVAQRWGPPFAVLSGPGPDLWVSGPGTSAARSSAELPVDLQAGGAVRPVLEVEDVSAAVETLVAGGWSPASGLVEGPGGGQRLMRHGSLVVEVFAGG
jgi:hypothetical protein